MTMVRLVGFASGEPEGQFFVSRVPRKGEFLRIKDSLFKVERVVHNFLNNRESIELYIREEVK